MERARELWHRDTTYQSKFETDYFVGAEGIIIKFSLMPLEMDTRPDVFARPITTLGMKRIHTNVTTRDLWLLDAALYIFESKTPLRGQEKQ
jgi:hypothetical protein